MKEWIVDIKGGPDEESFEISVVRSTNSHGRISYGWFGPDKYLISSSGGVCRDKVRKDIFSKLVRVAEEIGEELNNLTKTTK